MVVRCGCVIYENKSWTTCNKGIKRVYAVTIYQSLYLFGSLLFQTFAFINSTCAVVEARVQEKKQQQPLKPNSNSNLKYKLWAPPKSSDQKWFKKIKKIRRLCRLDQQSNQLPIRIKPTIEPTIRLEWKRGKCRLTKSAKQESELSHCRLVNEALRVHVQKNRWNFHTYSGKPLRVYYKFKETTETAVHVHKNYWYNGTYFQGSADTRVHVFKEPLIH